MHEFIDCLKRILVIKSDLILGLIEGKFSLMLFSIYQIYPIKEG